MDDEQILIVLKEMQLYLNLWNVKAKGEGREVLVIVYVKYVLIHGIVYFQIIKTF